MRHTSRAAVALLLLTLASQPALAEDRSLADCLPEDIPGGRDSGAQALKSGIPQLVETTLRDLMFAQEEPVFLPWKVAMEGKAASEARQIWIEYMQSLHDRDIEAKPFRADAARWFELQTEMDVAQLANLTWGLKTESDILARRLEEPARQGNLIALGSLAANPAGHEFLYELCKTEDMTRKIVYMMGASFAQSVLFRPYYEEWADSVNPQVKLAGLTGLLRLGDPADVKRAAAYLADLTSIRRSEVYRALSWIRSKEAVDTLLAEEPNLREMNCEFFVLALARMQDPRILPTLRRLRDREGFTRGVCRALRRQGRSGDVPWLLARMDEGMDEAAWTLRHLLGRSCPVAVQDRVDAVRKWVEAHKDAIEKDEELPLK